MRVSSGEVKCKVNLVMFTTINIYETILDKYYVHHILKICIFTGMTATTQVCALPYSAALKLTRGNF